MAALSQRLPDRLRPGPVSSARILSYVRPHRRRAALALGCVFAQSLLALVPVLVLKELVEYLGDRGRGSFGHVAAVVGIGFVATLAAGLLGVAQTYLTLSINTDVVARLRLQLFDRLVGQSVGYFTTTRAGDLTSRMLNDVGSIESTIGTTLLGLASSAVTAVASLALAFYLDWRLTLITLIAFPPLIYAGRRASRTIVRRRTAVQLQLSEVTSYLQEVMTLSGMTLVKSFSRERAERVRFGGLIDDLRAKQVDAGMAARWFTLLLQLIQIAAPALLFLVGGLLVVRGQTSLGALVAFVVVAGTRFAPAVQGVATGTIGLVGSLPAWRRIFEVLDQPSEIAERPDAHDLADVRGAIELQDVVFAHRGQSPPALRGVSARIEPGQLVALVGPSGAGKTTLTSLVARFHDPQEGSVAVDGHDVRDLTLASLQDAVGMVLQETYLFHGTIGDNLRYARPEATQEEVVAAARAANLHDVIAALPDGYDTLVGDRGHRLSGGERQRAAIARVILKDAPIVILDEATAHLDSVSEQLIQAALGGVLHGRTTLAIAHRLSTIHAADLILVLDRGLIVERGTHDELIALGGLYARLYDIQFRETPAATVLPTGGDVAP